MVSNPDALLEEYASAGSDIITVHAEACTHLDRTLSRIRELGCKAGVSLNPHTPIDALQHVLDRLDLILVMTVNPGFGGQSFIQGTLNKIAKVRKMIDATGKDIKLEVDGGVNLSTIAEVAKAGADTFVAGSAIFGTDNYEETITNLRAQIS